MKKQRVKILNPKRFKGGTGTVLGGNWVNDKLYGGQAVKLDDDCNARHFDSEDLEMIEDKKGYRLDRARCNFCLRFALSSECPVKLF